MCAGWELPHVFRLFIALQCSDHRAASYLSEWGAYLGSSGGTPEKGGDYGKEWLEIMGKRGCLISRRVYGPEKSGSGWGLVRQP